MVSGHQLRVQGSGHGKPQPEGAQGFRNSHGLLLALSFSDSACDVAQAGVDAGVTGACQHTWLGGGKGPGCRKAA